MFRHLAGCIIFVVTCGNANAQCPISVSAGPDIVRCTSPASAQLSGNVTGSYLGFTWSPTTGMSGSNTLNPTVNVTQTTSYILTATALDVSTNLIVNGNFEQGTTGFTNDYIHNPGDLWPEGVYDVLPNPNAAHPDFPNCGDHTSGSGNMLAVNGSSIPGVDVWCQTVSVSPNTQYVFTAWATSLVASSPARLQFSINGATLGSIFNVSSQTCTWQNFYAVWNSGPVTSANICIVNQNTAQSGNDFAVDDIVFSPTCRVSDTVRVEVANIRAMAPMPNVFLPCTGGSITLSGAGSTVGPGVTYQWQTSDGNIVSGSNTLSPVVNSTGSYVLTVRFVTPGGAVCEQSATVNVLFPSNPLTAIILPPPQLSCAAPTVTLIGSATPSLANLVYEWSVVTTGNIVGSLTNKNAIVNQPGTYQLMITNTVTGCISTTVTTVTSQTGLIVAQASADTITCVQSTAVLSGAGSSTGAGIVYFWSTPNGMIVSGQNNQNAEAGMPGTYILRVTNTNNGCIARDTVVVVVNKILPYAAINPPESIDCDSDTIRLFVNLSPPPFVLLVWTAEDGGHIASGQYTPSPEITAPGTYILQTVDPINGCISIDTVPVVSNFAQPTAAALPADTISCQQTSVVLSGAGSSEGFNFGYNWTTSGTGNIVDSAQTLSPEVNAPGLYTLTVLNYFNGCTDTASVLVPADTTAVTAITTADDTLTCSVFSTALHVTSPISGAFLTYTWTTTEGYIISGADTPDPLVSAPGMYEVILTNTANGCSATDIVQVIQDTLPPTVQVNPSDQITCAIPVQSITTTPLFPFVAYTYSWTAGTGGNIVSATNGPAISVDAPGTYLLIVSDPVNGCTAGYNAIVMQEAGIPVVMAATPGLFTCVDTLLNLSAAGSSTGAEYTYSWSAANGGNILSGNDTPNPVINAVGTYFLQIINQNNGCTAFDTVIVAANTLAPPAVASPPGIITCAAPFVVLQANENLPLNNLVFQWSTDDGHISNDPNNATTECDETGKYYLVVTDTLNGCISIDSLEITENRQAPSLFVAPPFPLTCAMTAVNLKATATGSTLMPPLFQWQSGNGHFVSGDTTDAPLVDAPGNYSLTVTDPVNGCTKTGGAIVFQNITPPPIQVLPANLITCSTPEQTLQGQNQAVSGNFTYIWSAYNGGNITSGDSTLLPTVNAAGIYLLTAVNLTNGCQAVDSVAVLQNTTLPLADAGLPDTLNCLNNSLTIQGTAAGQGTLTYVWTSSVTGNITGGATTLSPTVDLPGTYTLLVTDQLNGCKSADSVQVFQDANAPSADAGPAFTLTCQQTQAMLQGIGSIGAPYSYLWTTTAGNILGDPATLNPLVDAPGLYVLRASNADNGCIRMDSVVVTENLDAPSLSISTPGLLTCTTVSVQLSAQTPVPGGTFIWTTPDGNISMGNSSPNPIVNQPGTYIATATDPLNGCFSRDSIVVGSNTQIPVLTVNTPAILTCAQTQIPISGTVMQPANNFSVQWTTIGGTFVSGQNTSSPQVSAAGTYQMNVLDQANGCTAFVSVVVNEDLNLPTASASSNQQITCDSTVVALSAAGSSSGPEFTYLWSGQNIVSGQTTTAPKVSATGTFTLIVTDESNGCRDSATTIVTANITPPVVAIAVPLPLTCVRDSILINAGASNNGAAFQIGWTTGTGHFIAGQNTLTPLVDEPGAYILTIENTINGCSSTQTIQVLQNIAAPGAAIAPVSELHCNRQEATLSGSSPAAQTGFAWTTANGQIIAGASAAVSTIAAPGTYQLLVTDQVNGCTSIAQVTVGEAPAPDFLPVIWQPDCHVGTGAVDFGPIDGGKAPFRYSINGGQSYDDEASFESLTPGVYELVVQDAYGCTAVEMREVETPFFPGVTLTALHELELGEFVQLLPVLNLPENNVTTWEWTPSTGLSCSDCPSPTAKPLEDGMYTLIITDLNGCTAQAMTQFRVNTNRVLYPPNIISPNGDGKNDFFNLFGKGVADIRWLRVYDRWGNHVYDAEHLPINDEMQGWNGVFRGQPVSPGVFVWQAMVEFIDGVSEIFSGDVTVVR